MTLPITDLDLRSVRPQRFGHAHVRKIVDPLIEPLWNGERVLVAVGPIVGGLDLVDRSADVAFLDDEGEELEGVTLDAIAAELREDVRAESLLLDGYLTRQPTTPTEPDPGLGLAIPTATQFAGQMFFGRRAARATRLAAPGAQLPGDRSVPVAFVVVDLLAIDDLTLLRIPLLERKRVLESALGESLLVRRGLYVRPPVDSWLVAWRSIGFHELAYKASNSRYTPGVRNDAWARIAIPLD